MLKVAKIRSVLTARVIIGLVKTLRSLIWLKNWKPHHHLKLSVNKDTSERINIFTTL